MFQLGFEKDRAQLKDGEHFYARITFFREHHWNRLTLAVIELPFTAVQ